MSDNNPLKPRLREIAEGALGNIIGAIALAILGIAGGVTIGWLPTFFVILLLSGGLITWYKLDPSFQRLLHQRLFKLKHAISAESVVMSRWNLITDETISTIIRQNNLSRSSLRVIKRQVINYKGKEHLELALDYQLDDVKWLILVDNVGTVIDLYGGFQSVFGECDECGATVLTRYGRNKVGHVVAEPTTTCRRCKKQSKRSVINLNQHADADVRLQKIDEIDIKPKGGKVCVKVKYTVKNFGGSVRVCPKLYLKTAYLKDGRYIQHTAKNDLPSFDIPSSVELQREFEWLLPYEIIVLTKEVNFLKIEFQPC